MFLIRVNCHYRCGGVFLFSNEETEVQRSEGDFPKSQLNEDLKPKLFKVFLFFDPVKTMHPVKHLN